MATWGSRVVNQLEPIIAGTLGQPTTPSFSIDPFWPTWCLVILVTLAIAILGYFYRKELARQSTRWILFGLRVILLLLTCWIALRMTNTPLRSRRESLVVLIDNSSSMATVDSIGDSQTKSPDEQATKSRLDQVKSLMVDRGLLRSLAERYEIHFYTLNQDLPIELVNNGQLKADRLNTISPIQKTSPIGDWIRKLARRHRGEAQALLMISDGIVTDGVSLQDSSNDLRATSTAMYTICVGASEATRDIGLTDVQFEPSALLNDLLSFNFSVESVGQTGKPAQVRLLKDDRLLESKAIVLDDRNSPAVTFVHQPSELGIHKYEIRVDTIQGEQNEENNVQMCLVNVRDEVIKVLLAFEYPSYEYRYLQQALRRHDGEESLGIELTTVLQSADSKLAESDDDLLSSLPQTIGELQEFDVIVLGDIDPDRVPENLEQSFVEYVVRMGKSLILIAGPKHLPQRYAGRPLQRIMPFAVQATSNTAIHDGPFSIRLTSLGEEQSHLRLSPKLQENASLWSNLQPLEWRFTPPELYPATQVLAESVALNGVSSPLICEQVIGAGRVRTHLSDETFRWRFRVGDQYFGRYWLQTLRHLSNQSQSDHLQASLSSNQRTYTPGENIQLTAKIQKWSQPTIACLVKFGNEEKRQIILTRSDNHKLYRANIGSLPIGKYTAELISTQPPAECDFTVQEVDRESINSVADAAGLKQLAEQNRGIAYDIESATNLLRDIPIGKPIYSERLVPISLWNSWPVAILFIGTLVTEWLIRRRVGLF